MSVKSIIAYFNTSGTDDGTDTYWFDECAQAGGPSEKTICDAYATVGKFDGLPIVSQGKLTSQAAGLGDTSQEPVGSRNSPVTDNDLNKGECWANRRGTIEVQPCKSQATRLSLGQGFASLRSVFSGRAHKTPLVIETDSKDSSVEFPFDELCSTSCCPSSQKSSHYSCYVTVPQSSQAARVPNIIDDLAHASKASRLAVTQCFTSLRKLFSRTAQFGTIEGSVSESSSPLEAPFNNTCSLPVTVGEVYFPCYIERSQAARIPNVIGDLSRASKTATQAFSDTIKRILGIRAAEPTDSRPMAMTPRCVMEQLEGVCVSQTSQALKVGEWSL
jgi:hypothetical protein